MMRIVNVNDFGVSLRDCRSDKGTKCGSKFSAMFVSVDAFSAIKQIFDRYFRRPGNGDRAVSFNDIGIRFVRPPNETGDLMPAFRQTIGNVPEMRFYTTECWWERV
jgi:hypothetical protein